MVPKFQVQTPAMNRRTFVKFSLGAPTLASTVWFNLVDVVLTSAARQRPLVLTSLDKAYVFLDKMMDLYSQGKTIRLLQSYVPTAALNLGDTGFTYDNALALLAFLQRGQTSDLQRARVLANSLLYGQQHDPNPSFSDGALRSSYHVDPYVLPNGQTSVSEAGILTGNVAWAGLALAHFASRTGQTEYLDSAVKLGTWIQQKVYDRRGAGGYNGGFDASQSRLRWKSTEHNIDVFAFFTMLASLTGNQTWSVGAKHARLFVRAMWDSTNKHFWTGTTTDGVTINMSPIPEDVQSWSFLALKKPTYATSLDWAKTKLAAIDGSFSGMSFSNADTSAVWFEGTAHLALALLLRNAPGDSTTATTFLQNIRSAQSHASNNDGLGIVAASHDGLQTGFGSAYYAALHVGATAWYCLAKQKGNPFKLRAFVCPIHRRTPVFTSHTCTPRNVLAPASHFPSGLCECR